MQCRRPAAAEQGSQIATGMDPTRNEPGSLTGWEVGMSRLTRMCGRIALYDQPDRLARMLDAGVDPDLLSEWHPGWNVAPTDPILGVSERNGERTLRGYRWGLVPNWAKDPADVKGTFNARAETVATKPMFRSAFQRWRILVAGRCLLRVAAARTQGEATVRLQAGRW